VLHLSDQVRSVSVLQTYFLKALPSSLLPSAQGQISRQHFHPAHSTIELSPPSTPPEPIAKTFSAPSRINASTSVMTSPKSGIIPTGTPVDLLHRYIPILREISVTE
jgi:hypothetical protein